MEQTDARAGVLACGTGFVGFYHEYEENGCFSNWYEAEFDYGREHFLHTEQFMMYHKVLMFGRSDLAAAIMKEEDPLVCKRIAGQKFPEFRGDVWEANCKTIVKRGVRAKFLQNPDILKTLLGTGNAILAECAPGDTKWGIGVGLDDPDVSDASKWRGQNLLGRILMEVRDEIRQEMQSSPDGRARFVSALEMSPVPEWNMTAGELRRIPQFYDTVHAYSDTLKDYRTRTAFYNGCSLYRLETAMRGGSCSFPVGGFFELKQDVYDIARRLRPKDDAGEKRAAFCRKYVPILQVIEADEELKRACAAHSAYSRDTLHPALTEYLYREFMHEAYDSGMVIPNYMELIEEQGAGTWVQDPSDEELSGLDAEHLLACIAWHFRRDHFSEGALVASSIAEGHMLRMLKAYLVKA